MYTNQPVSVDFCGPIPYLRTTQKLSQEYRPSETPSWFVPWWQRQAHMLEGERCRVYFLIPNGGAPWTALRYITRMQKTRNDVDPWYASCVATCEPSNNLQAVDPLTGGEGRKPLISSVVKACICLGLVFSSFICFAQSARYWVHLVRPSNSRPRSNRSLRCWGKSCCSSTTLFAGVCVQAASQT